MPPYMNDVQEVVRAFAPYISVTPEAEVVMTLSAKKGGGEFDFYVSFGNRSAVFNSDTDSLGINSGELEFKRRSKAFAKKKLYEFVSEITGITLPYGALTGVRPTAVYYRSIGNYSNIKQHLIDDLYVEEKRAGLIERVVNNQKGYLNDDPKIADVFVNIPICPTRCAYCSFISAEYQRVKKLVPVYVECVLKDIEKIKAEAESGGYRIGSVYIGGGTPTTLEAKDLKRICRALPAAREFTVEAGRPDTITDEKLAALKNSGVTRISVNPQTFSDETLARIGRRHSVKQALEAFEAARRYGFDINLDLIAGLPGETWDDFVYSLESALDLRPENLTVHSLSLKRGASLKEDGEKRVMDGSVKKMCDHSIDRLIASGYEPYYMYRQKNIADGLENVGYALPGKQCRYNIDYMEETTTVLSAGAGAVTKYVDRTSGKIERISHPKSVELYIDSFAEKK